MFYRAEDGHGLPHNPFKAIISPRPIAWISTQDGAGVPNLAPYSFFNGVSDAPMQVMFASTGAKDDQDGTKDTVANIRETGEFCVNIVSHALMQAMNVSTEGFDKGVNEFEKAGLTAAHCNTIGCPRVYEAPASLECKLDQIIRLKGDTNYMVIGEVTGVHLQDDCIVDGIFDVTKYQPLARLGYRDYAKVSEVFSLARPGD
ncbi:flavin reductase family protein [Cognatishimia sp.]|uniref:flavin reductase family protein n=1 Tax=Cognatishimia sp. TaxID=2211648 RepID=UPI0035173364